MPLDPALADLRKRARLTQADLAKRLGVDTSLVSRWEKGDRQPSPQQLMEFARAVGVTLDFLLNAEVRPEFQFRARQTLTAAQNAELDRAELDAAQQIHYLHAAHKLAGIAPRATALAYDPAQITDVDIADFAAEMRTVFHLNRVVSLSELKQAMAEQHIHVFEWHLPWTVSGMSYRGQFTVVFINRAHTEDRRLFTLAHELAHVLLHLRRETRETMVSTFGARDPDEKQANLFASELLMPTQALDRLIAALGERLREMQVLDSASRSFNVSRDALFYRLVGKGIFDWSDKKRYFTEAIAPEAAGSERVTAIDAQVAPGFLQLALELFDTERVSAGKLSEWFFAARPTVEDYLAARYLEVESALF